MHTDVTPQQIAQYQHGGYLAVRNFLSPAEVAELKSAVLAAIDTMGRRKVADGSQDWTDSDGYYDMVFTQRLNLWRISDVVKRYMLHPDLGRMACQLAGVEGLRVWHDQALIKEPFGNPTAWHLDNPYWGFYSHDSISIWIALEDATLENGCMWFIPGTHRMARFDNVGIGQNLSDLFKVYPQMTAIDPVPVPMKAGDCSFHNGLLAHGAGANMTRGRRIAMTCAYMPAGSTFNGQRSILSESYYNTLREGDVLRHESIPLVYGRDPVTTPA